MIKYTQEPKGFWKRRRYFSYIEVMLFTGLIYGNWGATADISIIIVVNLIVLSSRYNFFHQYKYHILEFSIDDEENVYIEYMEWNKTIHKLNCKLNELVLELGLPATIIFVNKVKIFKQYITWDWDFEILKELANKVHDLQKSKGIRTW